MKLVSLSIRRSTVPIVLFTILILLGLFSASKIKYALMPEITTATVVVSTVYPGAGPNEVQQSVTIPIEDAVASLSGIEEIESSSIENLSLVKLSLKLDADVDVAIQEATQKINSIVADLPSEIRTPSIEKFDLNALPIFIAGVTSDKPANEFYEFVDNRIKPELASIPGVSRVELAGGLHREIKIMLDPHKLEANKLNLLEVSKMVEFANMDLPTGKLKTKTNEMTIRLSGKIRTIDQLKDIIVGASDNGTVVKLGDIADIYDGVADPDKITRIDGSETIGIEISKQKDANSVEVAKLVRLKFDELEASYEKDNLKFKTADDQSRFTIAASDAVMHDLVLAIILVSLIMLVFLHSMRNSIFVLVAIPTSLISTFTAMYLFGFSFDLISLTSLSLVVGSLVDDAIVVIENIYRHMEMGKNRIQASYFAVKELGMTVTAITLVLVAVFLPIAFVTGVVGDILREYAVTIVVSMLLSLLVSFTLVPWMTSKWAKLATPKNNFLGKLLAIFESGIDRFNKVIHGAMLWSLKHKVLTLIASGVLFFGTFYLFPAGYIGAEFTSAGDRGSFILRMEFPHNISLEENNNTTRKVEEFLMNQPEVDMVYATVGKKSGMVTTSTTPYFSEVSVNMIPLDQRSVSTNIFARKIRAKLEEMIIGAKIKAVSVNIMGSEDVPLKYYVVGQDIDSVMEYSQKALQALKSIDGTVETELSVDLANPEYKIEVDRDKMTKLGLNLASVGGVLRTSFAGNTDNKFRDGEQEYDINIQLNEADRRTKKDLENITFISSSSGELIKLSQFADITESSGPSNLERYNRSPSVQLTSQIIGVSQSKVQSEFDQKLKEIKAPESTKVTTSKQTQLMADSFTDLGMAFLAAIIFVYLIMVVLYNSWADPFIVMFSIPLSITGAIWALALTNLTLNIFSILGIIMLVGLVAKNAILIVDFANDLMREGKALTAAISEAVELRFRPILMTNVSMIIGLLPLAFSQSEGAEWKNGIGWTLIGGMTVSMVLSMIIVPVVYYIVKRLQQKMGLDKKEEIVFEEA
ncbi:efflux RND transporter permease subunit [Mangrovibacterium diazotrophicum]|uniref:HAE1 family hydrophobic/amphiphilic exporter-1 n=1 Tax=Mangrovibacterium diazotrophicum TaxID=1261403 RepID=A0A419W5B9_9BACT|nr:efflux RND transporter permease subunit [Mangrovibacterium diazotrophicum]RKD90635.1 HAE1 family hydrophobic/amphiphilic exporter-1 [Mangrovibacterium diazotrophicum]